MATGTIEVQLAEQPNEVFTPGSTPGFEIADGWTDNASGDPKYDCRLIRCGGVMFAVGYLHRTTPLAAGESADAITFPTALSGGAGCNMPAQDSNGQFDARVAVDNGTLTVGAIPGGNGVAGIELHVSWPIEPQPA